MQLVSELISHHGALFTFLPPRASAKPDAMIKDSHADHREQQGTSYVASDAGQLSPYMMLTEPLREAVIIRTTLHHGFLPTCPWEHHSKDGPNEKALEAPFRGFRQAVGCWSHMSWPTSSSAVPHPHRQPLWSSAVVSEKIKGGPSDQERGCAQAALEVSRHKRLRTIHHTNSEISERPHGWSTTNTQHRIATADNSCAASTVILQLFTVKKPRNKPEASNTSRHAQSPIKIAGHVCPPWSPPRCPSCLHSRWSRDGLIAMHTCKNVHTPASTS